MEESVFQKDKLWKEVLDPSGILNQSKSLMSDLPVNVAGCLVSQTLFGQENPKLHVENAPPSISETQRLQNFEEHFRWSFKN